MTKKEKAINVSGKPKHSLDVNRTNGGVDKGTRSASTVRRLKMYNIRPKRDRKGKILKHELQSKDLPNTRIEPDRRWFGNTRVVNQKELEFFREELQNRLSSNYNVILKERKLPLSLLNDHQKLAVVDRLHRRSRLTMFVHADFRGSQLVLMFFFLYSDGLEMLLLQSSSGGRSKSCIHHSFGLPNSLSNFEGLDDDLILCCFCRWNHIPRDMDSKFFFGKHPREQSFKLL